jgi:biopolymer transport protein ExbB/biopolymer transport protein TolQ
MLLQQLLAIADTVGQAVLYILIALSVVSVAVTVDRFVYFARRKVDASALGKKLAACLARKDLDGARSLLVGNSVEVQVMREALEWVGRGTESVNEVVEASLREKKREYERGLLFLGTLGNNAPFVGLFGTVLGIVNSFRELGNVGASGQMGNVMSGVAEALVATAIGILVAIPAVVAFNYFSKRAGDLEENVATLTNYLFAQLKGTEASHPHMGNGAVATDHETPVQTTGAV